MSNGKCQTCDKSLTSYPKARKFCSLECSNAATRLSTEEKFKRNLYELSTGCILYGNKGKPGARGCVRLASGRFQVVSRYAWERVNGKIPAGLIVRHSCPHQNCVNVEHLGLGTKPDDAADIEFVKCLKEAGDLTTETHCRLTFKLIAQVKKEYRRTSQTYRQVAEKFNIPLPILVEITKFA